MSNPTISLIIPAYNEEKYIGACLDSVIRTSNGRILEILVIDNTSTDQTAREALKRSGVRVIREGHKGVTRARQRGFLESKGELLAFVDADARLTDDWLDRLIEEFGDPELACLSGPYVYYDFSPWLRVLASMYWNILALPLAWIVGYMAIAGNMVLPRAVLEKMGGFDTTIEFYGDDTDTARRAKAFGRVKFTPRFPIYSSGRRFLHQGIFDTVSKYVAAFFAGAVLHRAPAVQHIDFR